MAQELSDDAMANYYAWVMESMREAEVSDSYGEWIALLIDKKGEDQRKLGRKRDLWLMCHGMKVITMILQEEYGRLVGVQGSVSQGGWTENRGGPEMTLVLRAQEVCWQIEEYTAMHLPWPKIALPRKVLLIYRPPSAG